ncbi:hypothetical protein K437DRAFT_232872 [Tilletiaria anomala UBC 951]|uniref:AAA+ ATPase domain-containing protein n=1 Tax=Tilletiaria anomala (strain ATCC 24038 / CBS 436.72 / UBC 951) TaxID=1037660 RepID=A0A066WN41_TILAU|nr:uncharacterized protein K437DRAFT_232872 [Tilletiaria anomala UBC 951]KDN52050.1 hypothetical protein K437DRAFT_232872 [Tilletiaria anomala UBC 951]
MEAASASSSTRSAGLIGAAPSTPTNRIDEETGRPISPIAGLTSNGRRNYESSAAILTDTDQDANGVTLEDALEQLVDDALANPRNTKPYSRLIPEASKLLNANFQASTSSSTSPLASSGTHMFCAKAGALHNRKLHAAMMRIFSFKLASIMEQWIQTLWKSIFSCKDCYMEYLEAKERLNETISKVYPRTNVEQLLEHIESSEADYALHQMDEAEAAGSNPLESFSADQIFALGHILATTSTKASSLLQKLKNAILGLAGPSSLQSSASLHRYPQIAHELTPGLLSLLLVDDDTHTLQSWAQAQLHGLSTTTISTERSEKFIRRNPMFEAFIRSLLVRVGSTDGVNVTGEKRQAIWQVVTHILHFIPNAASSFASHVAGSLSTTGAFFSDVLKCYRLVLDALGPGFWRLAGANKDAEYPHVLLAIILDNTQLLPAIEHCATSQVFVRANSSQTNGGKARDGGGGAQNPALMWMLVHARSLQEEGCEHAFKDALKILANFLLEKLQQAHFAVSIRTQAMFAGISVLSTLLSESVSNARVPSFTRNAHTLAILDAANMYAPTLVGIGLRGRMPNSQERLGIQSSLCSSARKLLRMLLEMDARKIKKDIGVLSQIAQDHLKAWKGRYKERADGSIMNAQGPSAKDVLSEAAEGSSRYKYPHASICKGLWDECYATVANGSVGMLALETLLPPLALLAPFIEPTPATLVALQEGQALPEYKVYRLAIRTAIERVSSALLAVRQGFSNAVEELSMMMSEDNLTALCTSLAESLIMLNLSPDDGMHLSAQNLVRAAFTNATMRVDCFRSLLHSNPDGAFKGICKFLEAFIQAAEESVEANALAKWVIRSLADVLDVLCETNDGLLRDDTDMSLLSDVSPRAAVAAYLPRLWSLMCKSVSVIFQRTPKWSATISKSEMVAWFRDVTLFATEVVEQVKTVQDALASAEMRQGEEGPNENVDALTLELVLPLEKAMAWLRLNDEEIMHETLNFVIKALACFSGKTVELPADTRGKMLEFVNSQMQIEDANKRMTLLSINELSNLKHHIDPRSKPVEIIAIESDSDSDSGDAQPRLLKSKDVSSALKKQKGLKQSSLKDSTWWGAATAVGARSKAVIVAKPKVCSEQQSKLDFKQTLALRAREGRLDTPSVYHRPTSSHQSQAHVNKLKAVSALRVPSNLRDADEAPSSKISQLRQEFRSSNAARPTTATFGRNKRPIAPPTTGPAWEVPTKGPKASSAVPSVATVASGSKSGAKGQGDSESSSDESQGDDGEEVKGLASLRASIIKKTFIPKKAPEVKVKLLEDDRLRQTIREQEELERKRRLRAPPDFSSLHQSLLSWDFHETADAPPRNGRPRAIPSTFSSAEEYMTVFGPLLLMECWAQLQQAKEEMNASRTVAIEVTSRSNVDAFADINAIYTNRNSKLDLRENDIVFLRELQSETGRQRIVLAKVQSYRKHNLGHQVVLRACLRHNTAGMNSAVAARTRWEVGPLFSLATIHRECAALLCAPYLDLRQQIFRGLLAPKPVLDDDELRRTMEVYDLNSPQATAILGSLHAEGFSLIQGPPGTGKTKTICGLIAKFISDRAPARHSVSIDPMMRSTLGPNAKILICAPSNAAIDELVKRVKMGLPSESGQLLRPKIIRLGRDESMNVEVKDVSLEFLLDQAVSGIKDGGTDALALQEDIRNLQTQRQVKQAELEEARMSGDTVKVNALQAHVRLLMSKRTTLMSKLDEVKDQQKADARQREAERRKIRQQIVMEADIICSTLSAAGHEILSSLGVDFETVVIDEAAQAVELSTLIPLRYGCKRCILVGDPNQLPPTVLSKPAERLHYNQSLFVRLFRPHAVYLLSIQYRMHPSISRFPSSRFYNDELQDGPDMAIKTMQPWHQDSLTPPYCFFDVRGNETKGKFHSLMNVKEAQVAQATYERLRSTWPQEDFSFRIGIVSMYKAQVEELRRVFATRYGAGILSKIDFNTVDGFQGQEKDIIILSCVRGGPQATIGFLNDIRRVNVAITRARSSLFILGNTELLRQNDTWAALIERSAQAGLLKSVTPGYFSQHFIPPPVTGSIQVPARKRSPTKKDSAKSSSTVKQVVPARVQRAAAALAFQSKVSSASHGTQAKAELALEKNARKTMRSEEGEIDESELYIPQKKARLESASDRVPQAAQQQPFPDTSAKPAIPPRNIKPRVLPRDVQPRSPPRDAKPKSPPCNDTRSAQLRVRPDDLQSKPAVNGNAVMPPAIARAERPHHPGHMDSRLKPLTLPPTVNARIPMLTHRPSAPASSTPIQPHLAAPQGSTSSFPTIPVSVRPPTAAHGQTSQNRASAASRKALFAPSRRSFPPRPQHQ